MLFCQKYFTDQVVEMKAVILEKKYFEDENNL